MAHVILGALVVACYYAGSLLTDGYLKASGVATTFWVSFGLTIPVVVLVGLALFSVWLWWSSHKHDVWLGSDETFETKLGRSMSMVLLPMFVSAPVLHDLPNITTSPIFELLDMYRFYVMGSFGAIGVVFLAVFVVKNKSLLPFE